MRTSLKAPIAIALGAALIAGSLAPAFAFGGVASSLRGASQGESTLPHVQVRGGLRYDKLMKERALEQRYAAQPYWWGHGYGTRGGVAARDLVGQADGYL